MGEQEAESLHACIHKLEMNYATIPNKLDRLKNIFYMYNLVVGWFRGKKWGHSYISDKSAKYFLWSI